MILFHHRLTKPWNDHYEAGRWVLELSKWGISYHIELLTKDRGWQPIGSYYFAMGLRKHFRLGSDHIYYDGPHCSFSLGFLHFSWSYWWCKKCLVDT